MTTLSFTHAKRWSVISVPLALITGRIMKSNVYDNEEAPDELTLSVVEKFASKVALFLV